MILSEGAREIKNKYARDYYKKNNGIQKAYRKAYRAGHKEQTASYAAKYWEDKALKEQGAIHQISNIELY